MKKLLYGLFLLSSFLFSAIDECKTDIYFANGILTEEEDARKNARDVLKPAIIEEFGLDYYNKNIGKVDYAYNETHGQTLDLLESTLQKLGPTGFVDWLLDTSREKNIDEQVKQYKESIKNGHKVLVVAHSQGNLFTQEVYLKLDDWMKEYFDGVSIASPGMYPMIPTAKNPISWDNDLVAWLGIYTNGLLQNDIRKVDWEEVHPNGQLTIPYVQKPSSNYVTQSDVGKEYKGEWRATEGKYVEKPDSNVHAFTFYMGEVIKDGDTKEIFKNPFDGTTMQTNKAKEKIMSEIRTKLGVLSEIESQWETNSEEDKNTCDYRITVKHRYDPSIEVGEKVYPFNASKKLYQVNGEWIKASCGGENIVDLQDNNNSEECWMIDNVEKEKIVRYNKEYIYSKSHIINIHGSCNQSLSSPIHIVDAYELKVKLYKYGGTGYKSRRIDLSTSISATNYSECVEKVKNEVVSIYNLAQNIVKNEYIKIDQYLRNKYPRASISYGEKREYLLNPGCHQWGAPFENTKHLGYKCSGGLRQEVYVKVFE